MAHFAIKSHLERGIPKFFITFKYSIFVMLNPLPVLGTEPAKHSLQPLLLAYDKSLLPLIVCVSSVDETSSL